MVEQRAVAVGRVAQLAEEIRERRARVIRVQARVALDVGRHLRVVRQIVERIVDAARGINGVADFLRDHERADAREIGGPRERQQVEHQLRMLLEIVGHACGLRRHVEIARTLLPASSIRRSTSRTSSRWRSRRARSSAGQRARRVLAASSSTESSRLAARLAPLRALARPSRRRRTVARTRLADSPPSAAEPSACATRSYCGRRPTDPSHRSSRPPRATTPATAAACPGRRLARPLDRAEMPSRGVAPVLGLRARDPDSRRARVVCARRGVLAVGERQRRDR